MENKGHERPALPCCVGVEHTLREGVLVYWECWCIGSVGSVGVCWSATRLRIAAKGTNNEVTGVCAEGVAELKIIPENTILPLFVVVVVRVRVCMRVRVRVRVRVHVCARARVCVYVCKNVNL